MLFVINSKLSIKQFVITKKELDEFAMDLITGIREKNRNQVIRVNFGYDNVHIEAVGTDFDVWIYNKKHLLFKNNLNQNLEVVSVE
jgi:hypothetical protein